MSAPHDIPFGRPWITDADRAAVLEVLAGHILTHGPRGHAFESAFAQFLGGGHCATTSSCMAALHLAALHFGFGPGDEVLVPAETHVATAHAVELTGARPVFVDCELATGNMDVAGIEAALTPRTKGIVVVHFDGIPLAMPRVIEIARARGLKVIEDCALALGARWGGRHVGLFGDAGCYSFYPVKHITTGEGGMFVSRHEDVAREVANFRAFNYDRSRGASAVPGLYDVIGVGMNCRMSEMQAALGLSQLRRMPEVLRRRAENFRALKRGIEASGLARVLDAADALAASAHYCLTAVLEPGAARPRDEVALALKARGIGTSIYYPQPVPRLAYYRKKYGYDPARYPGAEAVSDRSLALPVGPHLTVADMQTIAEEFAKAAGGRG